MYRSIIIDQPDKPVNDSGHNMYISVVIADSTVSSLELQM